ncbi:hypothetical protein MNBD_GAMMA15-1655 [hydrothermal vent metagenome]|uniref:Uncharacterized protein n=1 Tax=hydrothermal vent metagenome TaxID=652676 RepID=A0A3B0YSE9_9ZZZZ
MRINLRRIVLAIMYAAFIAVVLSSQVHATPPPSGECNGDFNCNKLEYRDESNTANARANSDASSQSTGTGVGVGIAGGGDAYAAGGNSSVGDSGNSTVSTRSNNVNTLQGGNATSASGIEGSGNSTNNNVSQGGNSDAAVSGSGNSTTANDVYIEGDTDNSSFEYRIPSFAAAGYSNNLIVDCQRILGFDFRGSGQTQSRGASFGVPLPGGACKLEKATLYAFDLGNYELGWMLYCAQKPVWKGYREVAQALTGTKISKQQAIVQCFNTAKVAVGSKPALAEKVDMSKYATKEQVNRAFATSQTK